MRTSPFACEVAKRKLTSPTSIVRSFTSLIFPPFDLLSRPSNAVLRKEWDALAASHPDRLTVVYSLDKPPKGWTGPTGYITPELVKKHAAVAAEAAGDKVKVFVCGVRLYFPSFFRSFP